MAIDLDDLDIRAKAKDFHDQFLLARNTPEPPQGWRTHQCGGWCLLSHPSLPVLRLVSRDGSHSGFALGHPAGARGRLARGDLELPAEAGAGPPSAAAIERWVYGFGGRFVFVVMLPRMQRLYLDPMGTLTAVWCGRRQRVASTPTLLLMDEPDHPVFRASASDFPRRRPNQFFPAGLTAAKGVRRLIVNHFLDLSGWTAARHHPLCAYEEVCDGEIPALVARFHEITSRQIGAMIRECGGAYLGLTAGEDSRRLLACARNHLDQLECVTVRFGPDHPDSGNDLDVSVATRLARHVGFRHRVLQEGACDSGASRDYLLRIGYSGGPGKVRKFWETPMRHLDLCRGWMIGHGGEIGRAHYWKRLPLQTRPTVTDLLEVMRLPVRPGFAEALESWLAGLPDGSPAFHLDMAHLEMRVGGWVGAHLHGAAPFRVNMLPLCHRDCIDAMLMLPTEFKAEGGLAREVLKLAWPELLDLPFNRNGGLGG